jgi:SAM-dependent methyltransferase
MTRNRDDKTVEGFGEEWAAFDQSGLKGREFDSWFDAYFSIFPFERLPKDSEGFDLGCGSGRWAARVADKVEILHCIDPAQKALAVARERLAGRPNVQFHLASVDELPLAPESQDFGYSLGVLHHVPDTKAALRNATSLLKPGAPFLLYLYYRFDQRPGWFRALWKASDFVRKGIARLPFALRRRVTDGIALTVYWPLSRAAFFAEKAGIEVESLPLSAYRNSSLYTLRTDALDRFGTRLEQRFTKPEIEAMMREAGLTDIRFSEHEPYWVACGIKA